MLPRYLARDVNITLLSGRLSEIPLTKVISLAKQLAIIQANDTEQEVPNTGKKRKSLDKDDEQKVQMKWCAVHKNNKTLRLRIRGFLGKFRSLGTNSLDIGHRTMYMMIEIKTLIHGVSSRHEIRCRELNVTGKCAARGAQQADAWPLRASKVSNHPA
jgi:hypothetical protein